jgi:glucose-1-phosphate adenylyltransferase
MWRRNVTLRDTLAVVLAGGQGERLHPLTRDRSKPAVPFGAHYRIIDFTLSNCLNSGLRKIYVLTQYKSGSLERHIQLGWAPLFSPELDEWIFTVPPQLRVGQRWYEGTADAVFQNIYLLERERPRRVVILSGDHVYKMNYQSLVDRHEQRGAVVTVGVVEVPREQARAFGVLQVDDSDRVLAFVEKPDDPPPIPGKPDRSLVNMGVYVFETETLVRVLCADARSETRHDFGHDILPRLVDSGSVYAYPFVDENRHVNLYWRDIGTLDAFHEASMDLVAIEPVFNLYDRNWPIRSHARQLPPAKFVHASDGDGGRTGAAKNSVVAGGAILSGGVAERSVIHPYARLNSYSQVSDSVLMDGVVVGRHARVHRSIVDKGVVFPEGFVVGEDDAVDRNRFKMTRGGIRVITKDMPLR